MTTHIVNMSFDIDDADIKRRIEESAEQKVINILVDDAKRQTRLGDYWEREELRAQVAKIIADELVDDVREQVINRCVASITNRKAFINAVSEGVLRDFMRESLKEAE